MHEHQTDGNTTDPQNASEPFGTVRNETAIPSEDVRNGSEASGTVPNESLDVSAPVRNGSEPEQKNGVSPSERMPQTSESFGTVRNETAIPSEEVRNGSEAFGTVPNESPNASEAFGTVRNEPAPRAEPEGQEGIPEPTPAERIEAVERSAPACGPEHEGLTITVREAARIFEEAGVPRTERAITNWCNPNGRGIVRLDCCYHEGERKYYLSPESVQRAIMEERKKMQFMEYRDGHLLSVEAESLSDQLRAERVRAEDASPQTSPTTDDMAGKASPQEPQGGQPAPSAPVKEEPKGESHSSLSEAELAELKELRMTNFELRVQLEGQKYLVRQFDSLIEGERERHEREKLALVDRLTDARHQIGGLEQKLLQLEAPRGRVRDIGEADEPRS